MAVAGHVGGGLREALLKVLVVTAFIPYFMPFHLSTDVQPLCLVVALIYLLFCPIKKINIFTIIFIAYVFFSIFNLRIESFDNSRELIVVQLSYVSVVVFFMVGQNIDAISLKTGLKITMIIYFVFSFIQILSPFLYKNYVSYLYNQKVVAVGVRGWSSLTPEPTDLAFTVGLILACYLLVDNSFEQNKFDKLFIFSSVILIVGCLALSGLVLLGWILFCMLLFSGLKKKIALVFLVALSVAVIVASAGFENRVVKICYYVFSDTRYVVENTSLFYRIFQNHLSVLISLNHLFVPAGINTFMYNAVNGDYVGTLLKIYPSREDYILNFFMDPPVSVKNVFARMLVENGIIFILWFFYVNIVIFFRRNKESYFLFVGCFVLYISQSFPVFYPPIWLLFGVAESLSRKQSVVQNNLTACNY